MMVKTGRKCEVSLVSYTAKYETWSIIDYLRYFINEYSSLNLKHSVIIS